jgi:hypothetical protein
MFTMLKRSNYTTQNWILIKWAVSRLFRLLNQMKEASWCFASLEITPVSGFSKFWSTQTNDLPGTTAKCLTTQCRTTQCRTTQCRTTQCRTTQCWTTQCRTTQCRTTLVSNDPISNDPMSNDPCVERPNFEQPNVERPNVEQPNVEQPNVERPNVEWYKIDPMSNDLNQGPNKGLSGPVL